MSTTNGRQQLPVHVLGGAEASAVNSEMGLLVWKTMWSLIRMKCAVAKSEVSV